MLRFSELLCSVCVIVILVSVAFDSRAIFDLMMQEPYYKHIELLTIATIKYFYVQ